MWKIRNSETPSNSPTPDSKRPALVLSALELTPRAAASACHQSTIGKGLNFVGEITGSESLESLFIEGSVEGSINLPGSRVTVGHGGQVTAGINARNIVVMGKINGNLTALDRLEIRAEGAVTGDVSAPRISIEDGAFLKGQLDVRKTGTEPAATVDLATHAPGPHKMILARPGVGNTRIRPSLQSA
ncbi:MAG: polymer-forming cytoskeletal protein [Terracidiphilus sp.]|jgi:cytoskeletal protein CcmA (bactofilin family)